MDDGGRAMKVADMTPEQIARISLEQVHEMTSREYWALPDKQAVAFTLRSVELGVMADYEPTYGTDDDGAA